MVFTVGEEISAPAARTASRTAASNLDDATCDLKRRLMARRGLHRDGR
jgi:hypothetical protein